MKTIMIMISMVTFLSFNSLGQNKEITKLLNNQETRKELFSAIQNDHELMTDFMQNAKGNQHAMMMMGQNGQMMGQNGQMGMNNKQQMMGQSDMMNMMHNNPEMMGMMMNNMISACATDSVMSRNLVHGMARYPQMRQMMKGYKNQQGTMGPHGQGVMMNGDKNQMNMNQNDQK